MNIMTLGGGGAVFESREKRDALVSPEDMAKLQELEVSMGTSGWAAEQLDRQASAGWLAARMNRPLEEVANNFDAYSESYFGAPMTPSSIYDAIVKHEADSLAMMGQAPSMANMLKAQPVRDGEEMGASKEVSKDAKPLQGGRMFLASFEKEGQDVMAGTFKLIEGALNSMGDNPEREGFSDEYFADLRTLNKMEAAGLDDTEQAQKVKERMKAFESKRDADFNARKAEFEGGTYRGALSFTAREHASFFYELGAEASKRYGVDENYKETFAGKAFEMGGQMLAGSAIMAAGALGNVGRVGRVAQLATVNAAGTASTFAKVTQERAEFEGDAYKNEGWAFAADLVNAGGQQALEAVPWLDNALEKAIKSAPRKNGTISWGEVLRQFPKQAAKSGGVEAGEEVLQGAWDDFIVDKAYDSERVNLEFHSMDYLKKRGVEAFAGFAGGVMMAGSVEPFLKISQNQRANKAEKLLTAKDGGLFMPRDFQLLRQARRDEQILAMPEGKTLLDAANGDAAAMGAYNKAIIDQKFTNTEGMELADGKLGMFEDAPAVLMNDGTFLVFDLSKEADVKRWAGLQQMAANLAEERALRKEATEGEGVQASRDMLEYIKVLQSERSGKATIEEVDKINFTEGMNDAQAQKMIDDYIAAGALPKGTTVQNAFASGSSDTKFDEKKRMFVTAIKIAKGANPLVILEESAHDYFKRQIEQGIFNEDTVRGWRMEVEAGWDAQMSYTEMHEWLAKYAVGYAVGKTQANEAQNIPSSFKRFLDRFAKLFKESLDFAAKVMQMERDGTLPVYFQRVLQEATGLVDDRISDEVSLMTELDDESTRGNPVYAQGGQTFSLERKGMDIVEDKSVSADEIDARNEVTSPRQVDEVSKLFREVGKWVGRPLLVVETGNGPYQALTGSHRLAAAIKAGVQVPIVILDANELENEFVNHNEANEGKRAPTGFDDFMGMDEYHQESALALVGGFNDALKLLKIENESNDATDSDKKTFSLSDSRAKPADASNVTVLPDGAQLVGPTTFSIQAFHGTPHKVDKFSTSKIGTGEGVQAYGWGLYFAESQEVAMKYQPRNETQEALMAAEYKKVEVRNDYTSMEIWESAMLHKLPNELVEMYSEENGFDKDYVEKAKNIAKKVESILSKSGGALYTVELLPDSDEFIDWDKPLSEQSEKVKAALAKVDNRLIKALAEVADGGRPRDVAVKHGVNVVDLYLGSGGAMVQSLGGDAAASKALASAGIAGIRYLDGASRGKGGTSNYVLFDDSLVKIIAENGKKVEQGVKTKKQPSETFSLAPIKTEMERALDEKVKAILGEQQLANWKNLGLKAIADMQAQTYKPRINAAAEVDRLTKGGTFGDAMGRGFMSIRGELDRFAKGLGTALQKTTHENAKNTTRDKKAIVALGKKLTSLENANEVISTFQVLGRRDDRKGVEDLAKIHGFTAELEAAEAALQTIRRDSIEAGVDVGKFWKAPDDWSASDAFKAEMKKAKKVKVGRVGEAVERVLVAHGWEKNIDFYWPSKVFDLAGLQEFVRGAKAGPELTEAYRSIEAQALAQSREVNEADLAPLMAQLSGRKGKGGPSSLKARTVANENINFAVMQFYYSPIEAALLHAESMRKNIQQRQFFGKSIQFEEVTEDADGYLEKVNLVNSTKLLMANLAAEGKISDQAKESMIKLIDARFNPTPANRFVSVAKSLGYVCSLGQIYSGQTATIDALAIGLREGNMNPIGIFEGIIQAATGKSFLTLEEVGIDVRSIGEDMMTDTKWENRMVKFVFEKISMVHFSRFYAQSGLNQAMNKAMRDARSGGLSYRQNKRLSELFGPDAERVMQDLAAGNKTDEVIHFAWATVAEYQSISQDQQTHFGLTSQFGKMFFQFKGFYSVQFTGMREHGWNEIKSGDPKRMLEGGKFLLSLAAALVVLGVPADMLRAFLTGRSFVLTDQVAARLMGMIGISPYLVREFGRDPIKAPIAMFIPSAGGLLTDVWRDGETIKQVIQSDADVSIASLIGNMRVWQNAPFMGKVAAERWGHHSIKNEENRENNGWFALTAPEDEKSDKEENLDAMRKRLEKLHGSRD